MKLYISKVAFSSIKDFHIVVCLYYLTNALLAGNEVKKGEHHTKNQLKVRRKNVTAERKVEIIPDDIIKKVY